jgi:ribose 5-phosphate isomerase
LIVKKVEDLGNLLIDVNNLDLQDLLRLEEMFESIPGVIRCDLFTHRRAELILVGHDDGSTQRFRVEGG